MDRARRGAEGGAPHFSVYGTDWQTAGRGRLPNRSWQTSPGEALTFTLVLRPPLPDFPLSLRLGLGLALWLDVLGVRAALKWPNDVLVDGRKLGGILVESTGSYALVGIGVNVHGCPPPEALRIPASCLADFLPPTLLRPYDYLGGLLARLEEAWNHPHPHIEVTARLYLRGHRIRYTEGRDRCELTGVLVGLGESGELLVEDGGGEKRLFSGEILGPDNGVVSAL